MLRSAEMRGIGPPLLAVVAWLSGSSVVHVNKVTLHRAQLVL